MFCVMVKLDLFCIYIYIYIYIFHCINLMIIETIQEVDVTGVHESTL
jgi:hypothetical protein